MSNTISGIAHRFHQTVNMIQHSIEMLSQHIKFILGIVARGPPIELPRPHICRKPVESLYTPCEPAGNEQAGQKSENQRNS